MNTTRSLTLRAKFISWVTISSVMPSSARSSTTFSTSPTSSGSSADVISSHSITLGLIASARAIATRCCWPPESWSGQASNFSASPTRASSLRAAASMSTALAFFTSVGANMTLRPTLRCGNRLKPWKIMPTCWRSSRMAFASACLSGWPSTCSVPSWNSSSPLMHRSSVLLPEPLLPMMAITSPRLTSRSTPLSTSFAP